MALLTRLDGLAEREAASEAHLRILSEDLDDYIDCIEEVGDADAFVEARNPVPNEVEAARPRHDDPELAAYARLTGCHHYRDVHPQLVRAGRGGFLLRLPDQYPDDLTAGETIGGGQQ